MITGGAWEDAAVGGRPVFFLALRIQITQNDAALGTWERLMGAARHPCCTLVQRGLKFAAGDQSKDVRSIVEQGDIFGCAESGHFGDRLGEEKEALAHYHELW